MSRLRAPKATALPALKASTSAIPSLKASTSKAGSITTAKPTDNAPSDASTASRSSQGIMGNSTNSLKRKAEDDSDADDQPRKVPAVSGGIQRPGFAGPVRPTRTVANLPQARRTSSTMKGANANASTSGKGSDGNGTGPRTTGTGPSSRLRSKNVPAGPGAQSRGPGQRGTTIRGGAPVKRGRNSSGISRPGGSNTRNIDNGRQIVELQEQLLSLQAARAADAARLDIELQAERSKASDIQDMQQSLSKELAEARSQEVTHRREISNASSRIENLKRQHAREIEDLEDAAHKRDKELSDMKEELRLTQEDLDCERTAVTSLKATVSQQATAQITLNTQNSALEAELSALKSTLSCKMKDASQLRLELEEARSRISELEEEVHEAESTRRRLHNTIQELKGNIRVFCRVRPLLPSDVPAEIAREIPGPVLAKLSQPGSSLLEEHEELKERCLAKIEFPDKREHKEILLSSSSESITGQERKETWNFTFDRVFEPHCSQTDVFEEISQLAQSCTDGYNVCIFAYGQTGSGKSFTMEGGTNEQTAGMIPRAVEQVFRVTEEMKGKGWEYRMEGQFLEIYNETINDLLGKGEFDKKKHEIKHDKGSTRVTDVVVAPLRSASQVRSLLSVAQSRRTVASTLMNERSSRSHSVFTLRIFGSNVHSKETCEGTLNLVDLAGSERLNSSGAANDKERLKETQNINRSLSALADVIAALGEKGDKSEKHVPYRNSKLTYLLQNSLSGSSKTLMFLNLSPVAAHLGESLCSLRFATKVNNTTIGTAKRQTRVGP